VLNRLLPHLHRNAIAYVALTIALGGISYAATALPRDSVGAKQIRAGAVRSSDVKDGALRLRDFRAGEMPPGPQDPPGTSPEIDVQHAMLSAAFVSP
jgi:hypothetical protein